MLDSFYRAFVAEQRYLLYLDGLKVTILVSVIAILIGVALGTILALMRLTAEQKGKSTLLSKIAYVYIDIIRGTPTLTQLMIMYFVIFANSRNQIAVAALAFGINSGAYVAEIIRGGIMAVDRGQMEAGRSLGFNYSKTMRLIIIPQAFKIILPALGNELITLVKETSIVTVIGCVDLLKAAQLIGGKIYYYPLPLFGVALVYLIIVMLLTWLFGGLERRLRADER